MADTARPAQTESRPGDDPYIYGYETSVSTVLGIGSVDSSFHLVVDSPLCNRTVLYTGYAERNRLQAAATAA